MAQTLGSILRAAEGQWLHIFRALAGSELREALAIHPSTRHCECPVHGGENGDAFRLLPDANETGGGGCNTCGIKANGIYLLSWLHGWSTERTMEEVAAVLGIEDRKPRKRSPARMIPSIQTKPEANAETNGIHPDPRTPDPASRSSIPEPRSTKKERHDRRKRWLDALRDSYPASESEVVQRYFSSRGLDPATIPGGIPDILRFHPALPYHHEGERLGEFPAIIARVDSTRKKGDNGLINIHRTYLDPVGKKLELPDPFGPGKTLPARKLEQPEEDGKTSGGAVQLYPLPNEIDRDGSVTLAITEGIENAIAVHAATGIPAWAATSAPLLAAWNYTDRAKSVEIWADHDEAGLAAARKLSKLLAAQKFRIKIIIPPDPGTDWLNVWDGGRGKDKMLAAQAAAELITPPKPDDLRDYGSDTDPHRLAHVFLAKHSTVEDFYRVRYFRQTWWRWIGTKYVEVDDDTFRAEVTATIKEEFDRLHALDSILKEEKKDKASGNGQHRTTKEREDAPHKVSMAIVSNVIEVMKSLTMAANQFTSETATQFPRWILDPPPPLHASDRNWFAFRNKLVSIDGILEQRENDEEVYTANTPNWFSPIAVDYDFDEGEDGEGPQCPIWEAFLEKNLEGDQERIAILQEWFGLCLVNDTSYQKFLILEGEGANGKSVICAALEAMLGSANVSHVPPDKFGDRFSLHGTLGKLANIVAEVGELDKIAEGTIKAFTSGDPMSFERKHKDPFDALPTARLIFATNNKPRFSDRSSGIWRRILFIPMRVQIPESERIRGMDKPAWWTNQSNELPGIFVWACNGYSRLQRQGGFTRSAIMEAAMKEYRSDSNPCRQFLEEHYQAAPPEAFVVSAEMYARYREWCKENGYHAMSDRTFGKEILLGRVFPGADRKNRMVAGQRKWVYTGVADVFDDE